MPRLLLMRHAKSAWDDPELDDFDRPLSERGRRTALFMAHYVADHDLMPRRILCSTARRTRETLALLLDTIEADCDMKLIDDLYDAPSPMLLDRIVVFGGTADTLLVIGHNPGLQQTALDLIGTGNPMLVAAIKAHYPTGGLAVLDFEIRRWSDLRKRTGRVVAFSRPRDLMEETVERGVG